MIVTVKGHVLQSWLLRAYCLAVAGRMSTRWRTRAVWGQWSGCSHTLMTASGGGGVRA